MIFLIIVNVFSFLLADIEAYRIFNLEGIFTTPLCIF
jgi:hypothetical protein